MRKKSKNPFIDLARRIGKKPYDIEELVVDRCGLTEILPDQLQLFPNLQVLFINGNKLTELCNLNYQIRLTMLDARDNFLTKVSLPKQTFLVELYLANNRLSELETFLNDIGNLKNLEVLDLRNNPLTQEKDYRKIVMNKFSNLKILDGIEIVRTEKIAHNNITSRSKQHTQRSISMLDYVKTLPLSNADSVVSKKAAEIRKSRLAKIEKRKEEETAAARMQKEAFLNSALVKTAPIPDAWKFNMPNKIQNDEEDRKPQKPRARSRMYIKTPTFKDSIDIEDEERLLEMLNPGMPRAFTRKLQGKKIVFSE